MGRSRTETNRNSLYKIGNNLFDSNYFANKKVNKTEHSSILYKNGLGRRVRTSLPVRKAVERIYVIHFEIGAEFANFLLLDCCSICGWPAT